MNSKSIIKLTLKDVVYALESANYRFAKTMPQHPHEYTLRESWNNSIFDAVVRFIREFGYVEYFYEKPYTMFNLNGYKYWTMGSPIPETILINRAAIHYKSEYDNIAAEYAGMFQDEDSKKEEEELFKLLDIKGKVLEIGCGGTGMLLNYITPEDYLGIDPSRGMLEQFILKRPNYTRKLLCCKAEDFYRDGFDTIVALFGTASYINPAAIERFKEMLNPEGKMYLMFYLPTYTPITHIETGIHPKIYEDGEGGQVFHNYNLVTYTKK